MFTYRLTFNALSACSWVLKKRSSIRYQYFSLSSGLEGIALVVFSIDVQS
jgi:hypothetical protein